MITSAEVRVKTGASCSRLSTEEQTEGHNLETRRDGVRHRARTNGREIPREYQVIAWAQRAHNTMTIDPGILKEVRKHDN